LFLSVVTTFFPYLQTLAFGRAGTPAAFRSKQSLKKSIMAAPSKQLAATLPRFI
jgi:hypothetical protein